MHVYEPILQFSHGSQSSFAWGYQMGEFSYLKTLFRLFDEQSKVNGEAKQHCIELAGQLPVKALCFMSNLSDYVYRIIPKMD